MRVLYILDIYSIIYIYIYNINSIVDNLPKQNLMYSLVVSYKVKLHMQFNSLLNLENTGPKLWVCEILCSYIQWCNKSCMHRKNNNSKINIIQIQYIKV